MSELIALLKEYDDLVKSCVKAFDEGGFDDERDAVKIVLNDIRRRKRELLKQ